MAMHNAEDELVMKCTNARIPMFNARVFLDNKEEIGKVDEIFGPINTYYCSVKMAEGMKADSFKKAKKLFIDTVKLMPLDRFLPMPGGAGGKGGKGKGKGKDKGKGKGKKGGKKGGKD